MDVAKREIDSLGRIVIPKSWRQRLGKEVILFQIGNEVRIRPKRTKNLSDLPAIDLSLMSPLSDWNSVHQKLME